MLAQRWNQKGKVIILSQTTDEPLTLMGEMAGICYGSDITNHEKNFNRGLDCLKNKHLRVAEFPKIYLKIEGYSAKVIREWYTHIIDTTRLQSSTRYINYKDFGYVIPQSIKIDNNALKIYNKTMETITNSMTELERLGIPKEDFSGLLPLNYKTTIVCCLGLREFINMCEQRLCTRAYHEYRELMNDILDALSIYSDEWKKLRELGAFVPKCINLGKCPEKNSCGKVK